MRGIVGLAWVWERHRKDTDEFYASVFEFMRQNSDLCVFLHKKKTAESSSAADHVLFL
jgi:hypothetical protein